MESHYYKGETPEKRQADFERCNDPQFTRITVAELGFYTKTWNALPELLFKTTEIDHPRFWAATAFYNFIQRPMNYDKKERPGKADFEAGWKVFANVAKIIQPSHCLFIGVTAANYFDLSMASQNITCDKVSLSPKVAGVRPRAAKIEIDGTATKLIFVHHLGRCKRVSQWHDYLQTQHTDFMNWLKPESYAITRNTS